ncbi:hypothetical protein K525DRAFT_275670 [Schizophyllum commune Loenen D]|nr:hypothetical protein K525DRAFT_275670 [Schizophyllum commune Loenen D]
MPGRRAGIAICRTHSTCPPSPNITTSPVLSACSSSASLLSISKELQMTRSSAIVDRCPQHKGKMRLAKRLANLVVTSRTPSVVARFKVYFSRTSHPPLFMFREAEPFVSNGEPGAPAGNDG